MSTYVMSASDKDLILVSIYRNKYAQSTPNFLRKTASLIKENIKNLIVISVKDSQFNH